MSTCNWLLPPLHFSASSSRPVVRGSVTTSCNGKSKEWIVCTSMWIPRSVLQFTMQPVVYATVWLKKATAGDLKVPAGGRVIDRASDVLPDRSEPVTDPIRCLRAFRLHHAAFLLLPSASVSCDVRLRLTASLSVIRVAVLPHSWPSSRRANATIPAG